MQSTSQLVSYLVVMDKLGGLFRVDLKLYPSVHGPALCARVHWDGQGLEDCVTGLFV